MSPVGETFKVEIGGYETGNILPLLHEIRHALSQLLETGEASSIDLRSLPMAPGELERLTDILGKGEISAQLNALGKSEIYETGFPGIWMITHYNTNEEIMGKFIEIARVPAILEAQTDDMRDALAALQAKLEEL